MTTYYCSNTGSDGNNGTSSLTPFATIGKAQSVGINLDSILLKYGDTFPESIQFANGIGLTIDAYGTSALGQPVIAPTAHSGNGAIGDAITFNNASNITVQNIKFVGPDAIYIQGTTTESRLLEIRYSDGNVYSGIIVNNCTFMTAIDGVTVGNVLPTANKTVCSNIRFTNNVVTGMARRGIDTGTGATSFFSFADVTVTGNITSSIPNGASFAGYGIYIEGADGVYAAGNYSHDIGLNNTLTPAGPCGIGFQVCNRVLCEYNVVNNIFNYHTSPIDGTGIDVDLTCTNTVVRYNMVSNCDGPGVAMFSNADGHLIHHNVLENTGRTYNGGLGMQGTGATIAYGNTVRSLTAVPCVGFVLFTSSTNKQIYNNVLISAIGEPTVVIPTNFVPTGFAMDGNYHQSGGGRFLAKSSGTSYTSLAAWQAATGFEASGVGAGNCYLVAPRPVPTVTPTTMAGITAYAPIPGSPVLNAGADLLGTYGISPSPDILGNHWTQNAIGAFYQAVNPTAYAKAVYDDNPLAWLRLGEASGTAYGDSVEALQEGVLSAVTLAQTPIVLGDGPTSASFNGTSSTGTGVILPTTVTLTALTLEATITPTVVNVANQKVAVSWNAGFSNDDFTLHLANAGLAFFVKDSSTGFVQCSTTALTLVAGTTYTIMAVWLGGTTMAIYVNGISQTITYGATTALANGLTLTRVLIGYDNAGSAQRWFKGSISDFSIYGTGLSSARATAHYNAASVPSYNATGPASGSVGVASAAFTVQPTSAVTDTVPIVSSVGGDTITSSPLSWSASGTARTFTLTPSSLGPRMISAVSGAGYSVLGSPFVFNSTVPLTVTGPSTVLVGTGATFTFTPLTTTSDTVVPSDNGAGGTFVPVALVFSSTAAAQTAQYFAARPGSTTITGNSSQGALFTAATTTVYAVQSDAYVDKTRKVLYVGTNSSNQRGNGQPVKALISTINTTPVFKYNGHAVQVGPAVSGANAFHFIAYRAMFGAVDRIAMSNAGTAGYTAPTAVWNGDGGGSRLTLGTPVLATGLIKYLITNAGTGYTQSFGIPVPGGTFTRQAWAWVNVDPTTHVVTSVVPMTGSVMSNGEGYTGTTIAGIALPGSGAYSYSTGPWIPAAVAGTGLVVTATVGKYIQSIPVTDTSNDFTSAPTLMITDAGSGAGAVAIAEMTGPLPSDVLSYTTTDRWLLTTVGSDANLSPLPVTDAPFTNWGGQLEGPTGLMSGFTSPPTMPVGANLGSSPSYYAYNTFFIGKNKLKAASPWQPGFGCADTDFTLDATYYPAIWTAKSWVTSIFYSFTAQTNTFTVVEYMGTWSLQYDDSYYATLSGSPQYMSLTASFEGVGGSFAQVANGPFTVAPTATANVSGGLVTSLTITNPGSGLQGVRVGLIGGGGSNAAFTAMISGGAISGFAQQCPGSGYGSAPAVNLTPISVVGTVVTLQYAASLSSMNAGGNMILSLNAASATGIQQVTNPWVFAPGNTLDRSKPYAADDNVVANLTCNGKGPGTIRAMDSLGGPVNSFMADASDIADPNLWSWQVPYHWHGNAPKGSPNRPTFTGTTIAGQMAVTGIADTSSLLAGNPLVCPGVIPGYVYGGVNKQTTISSVDSSSQVTLSTAAKVSGTFAMSVNPTPSGNLAFTKARFFNTNPASSTYGWSSPRLYSTENWANTGIDPFGWYLDITHGPLGADDNGNFIVWGNLSVQNGVVELTSPVPHGLKTGFYTNIFFYTQTFNGTLASGNDTVTGITGGGTSKLVDQVITGTGIQANTSIIATTSTTLQMSKPATANGSQSLTLTQALRWTASGLVTLGGPSYSIGPLWVTGPNSIVVLYGTGNTGGSAVDTIAGTVEVPVFIPCQVAAPNTSYPYEFVATLVANWPNTKLHLNVSFFGSDGYLASVAQRVGPILGPTNDILLEMGNEPWNSAADVVCEQVYEFQHCYLARYYPNGTALYPHYTPNRNVATYTANGQSIANSVAGSHTLRAANKHYAFCLAWRSLGLDPNRVKLLYNAQYNSQNDITSRVAAIVRYNLPQDYMAFSAYFGPQAVGPQIRAWSPAGYPGGASPGNWPVDAINSLTRHQLFYGNVFHTNFATMFGYLAGTALQPMGYEGGQATLVQNVPFQDQVQQDALYHSSFYDVFWCAAKGLEQGHPNVAGSGWNYYSYFSLYQNYPVGQMWKLADSAATPMGPGTANQFVTPQGGLPGTGNKWGYYQTNQTPGIQSLHDWIGQIPVAAQPTTSTGGPGKRWFPMLHRPGLRERRRNRP